MCVYTYVFQSLQHQVNVMSFKYFSPINCAKTKKQKHETHETHQHPSTDFWVSFPQLQFLLGPKVQQVE